MHVKRVKKHNGIKRCEMFKFYIMESSFILSNIPLD